MFTTCYSVTNIKTKMDQISDFSIFDELLKKRPEISGESLKADLDKYYIPYLTRIIQKRKTLEEGKGLIVGVSAIQGAGKTTQGEVMEILIKDKSMTSVSLSIDDHYLSHEQLQELREFDPRYIRRGVTHDIYLAAENLKALQNMQAGTEVKVPVYDKGANSGDGDWVGWKIITQKPDFIFYDGWMLGAKKVADESIFGSGLPGLDTPEAIKFAKDINQKLDAYSPLWELIDFMNVLYVPDYTVSIRWRDQAEEVLRQRGTGMSHKQIIEFVHYFWRSVHPAIFIKNLAQNDKTDQVVIINNDHSIKEVLTPGEVRIRYP